jgi:hypothetical protein
MEAGRTFWIEGFDILHKLNLVKRGLGKYQKKRGT